MLFRSSKEREVMDAGAGNAAAAIEIMITQGPEAAMNLYNKKVQEV